MGNCPLCCPLKFHKIKITNCLKTANFQIMSEHLIRLQQVSFMKRLWWKAVFIFSSSTCPQPTITFQAGLARNEEPYAVHVPEEKLEPLTMEHFYLRNLILKQDDALYCPTLYYSLYCKLWFNHCIFSFAVPLFWPFRLICGLFVWKVKKVHFLCLAQIVMRTLCDCNNISVNVIIWWDIYNLFRVYLIFLVLSHNIQSYWSKLFGQLE